MISTLAGAGVRHQLLADEVRYAHGDAGVKMWEQVLRNHKVDPLEYHLLSRLANRSRGLVSHSVWGCERLRGAAPNVVTYHIPIAANETPMTPPGQTALRSALRFHKDAFIAGVFGTLAPDEGITRIIKAFTEFVSSHPEGQLLIAAEQQDADNIEQITRTVREHGLEKHVRLIVRGSGVDFLPYMHTCDVLLDLSWSTSGQGSSTTALAAGLGKLAITADLPQSREIDEAFCWRIPNDNVAGHTELVSALHRAASNPDVLERARVAAERYAGGVANPKRIAQLYDEVVAQLLSTPTASVAPSAERVHPRSAKQEPPFRPALQPASRSRGHQLPRRYFGAGWTWCRGESARSRPFCRRISLHRSLRASL